MNNIQIIEDVDELAALLKDNSLFNKYRFSFDLFKKAYKQAFDLKVRGFRPQYVFNSVHDQIEFKNEDEKIEFIKMSIDEVNFLPLVDKSHSDYVLNAILEYRKTCLKEHKNFEDVSYEFIDKNWLLLNLYWVHETTNYYFQNEQINKLVNDTYDAAWKEGKYES